MQNPRPHPDRLNPNLNFKQIPKELGKTLNFEKPHLKHCEREVRRSGVLFRFLPMDALVGVPEGTTCEARSTLLTLL